MKFTIIIVVVLVVAALAFFYYQGGISLPSFSSLESQGTDSADAVGSQVLTLLNQIQSLKIDTSIFKDQAFQTLRDYSVAIPPQGVGRPNPFAPLPGVAAPR